ncbi:MAG: hypothetical protein DI597_16765 [Pseudoxanthomonas spadix]|nr:MAG: hypothetical protein DI597_16765 [Pseudoxanthomonas spadix]
MRRALIIVAAALILAILLGTYLFSSPTKPQRVGGVGIAGEYVAVVNLLPNSKGALNIDVYADFTCPACQRFESGVLPELRSKYGSRLVVRQHYVATPSGATSAKILYDLASDQGKGDVVADALFKANLKHGNDGANLPIVRSIAKKYSLDQTFDAVREDGSGLARIRAEWKSFGGRIAFFPFIVIEDEVAVGSDKRNIMSVIESLLVRVDAKGT